MAKSSRLLTAKEAQDIDARAREIFGISTIVLMENAGRQVADEVIKILQKKRISKIAIFCGRGNNGGDGFVVARHLLTSGIKADIFLSGKINGISSEARINLDILLKLKQKITEVNEKNLIRIKNNISKYDLIIDALLGVGLVGEVRGAYRDLISAVNLSQAYILSIDIPSGLDATTGRVLGCCVKADKTVTLVAKKLGMTINQGPKLCGEVIVRDLGIPL